MFNLSFAAPPDEWDLQVLENYYIDSIMLTTELNQMQMQSEKYNTGKVFEASLVFSIELNHECL